MPDKTKSTASKLIFIPALATDSRLYHRLAPHFPEAALLEWMEPLTVEESMHDYGARYAEKLIKDFPDIEHFTLCGVSMGGMVALEMIVPLQNLHRKVSVIQIASCRSAREVSFSLQMSEFFSRVLGDEISKTLWSAFPWRAEFSGVFDAGDKKLLNDMLLDTPTPVLRWSANAILNWHFNGDLHNVPYIHIHGSNDRVLPTRNLSPTHLIKGAGHLPILSHVDEVVEIMREFLADNA